MSRAVGVGMDVSAFAGSIECLEAVLTEETEGKEVMWCW